MKRLLLIVFTCLVLVNSNAQNSPKYFKTLPAIDNTTPQWAILMYSSNPNVPEVVRQYTAFYKEHSFEKSVHTQNYKHWLQQIEPLLNQDGFIAPLSKESEDQKNNLLKQRYQQRQSRSNGTGGWEAMGPFETYDTNTAQPISWHKNIYALDQSLTNPNLLICGTEAGGVYKSLDKGANWSLISLGEVFSGGNAAVKIHPTNPDNFLVASNNRIYQSTNGGNTWVERHFTNGTGNEFAFSPANSNLVFHSSSSGLFKSTNGGVSWSQVYTDTCWDVVFHPTNASIVYLLKSNPAAKRSELFRSTDGGNTWEIKDNGWYVPTDFANANEGGGKIGVTPAEENWIYVCLIGESKADDQGWIGVYKSTTMGDSWTNPTGQDGGPYGPINGTDDWNVAAYSGGYHQGYYNFDMEVSAVDANKLWIATIRLTESSDGGQTYQSIGAANSTRLDFIHADVQDIQVYGDDVWVASDGGVNYSNDELTSHVALNKGIQAAHFWGFNTGWNEDSFTGGKYHDGTSGWYEGYSDGKTYNIGGVEEASGYVHPIESRKMLYRVHYASDHTAVKTIPEVFGDPVETHTSLPVRPNESYLTAERSGVYFDPRYANHMFVGLENKIYKSTDGGLTFDVLYTFPEANGMVYEIEISRSNPDVMYCVYNKQGGYWDPCEIWKTTDGGVSWAKTTSDPTGNNRRFRISIDPENENHVWICTPRGENGNKVFSTENGGATWQNKTTAILNGEDVTDILYQGGSNDIVYVTSQYGVFYWNDATDNWIEYATDLPLVAKTLQINPFYRDGALRLASNGRGVWGRALVEASLPVAQPITYDEVIHCPETPVQFDCYSVLNHQNATWEWNITPAPQSISSTTVRNPEVVFGTPGTYSVSLTVTDAQGNTDTKTITDMITVLDDCQHCISYGNMDYATAVTLVDFNEISNSTGKTQPYTDYTEDFHANVTTGESYDLTVNVNTDGNYVVKSKVWIDWNQDLDFDDPGEEYDLGEAVDTADGPTSLSPYSIIVPQDALPGETVMRVSAKYNAYATPCETGYDGEVEDYAIIVNPVLGVVSNTFLEAPVLFPNPTKGTFSIDLHEKFENVNITLVDVRGRILKTQNVSQVDQVSMAVNYSDGIYFVLIESEKNRAVLRLIKE